MSAVALYAPTEVCETEEKEMFYDKLYLVLYHCLCRDTLIVLGNFNGVIGIKRAGYELCVNLHGSGMRNDNSSFLLNLAKSRWLRIEGSRYHRPTLQHWT